MPRKRSDAAGERRPRGASRPFPIPGHAPPQEDAGAPASVEEVVGDSRPLHAVYLIATDDLEPLYIGSTSQLIRRLKMHARERDWFTPDCRVFVEWHTSREDAYHAGAHAIYDQRPTHNLRVDAPSGACPDPVVPMRPLEDLDRDVAGRCSNCNGTPVHIHGLCQPCYSYRERYGADRPASMGDPYLATA